MALNTETETSKTLWKESIEAGKAFDLFPKKDYLVVEDISDDTASEMVDTCRGFIKENHKKELNSLSDEQQDNVLVMATWICEATGNLYSLNSLKMLCEKDFNKKKNSKDPDEEAYQEQIEFEKNLTYGEEAMNGKAKWLNVLRNHPLKKNLFRFASEYFIRNMDASGSGVSASPDFNEDLAQKTETELEKYANLEITKQKTSSDTKKTTLSPQLMTKIMGQTR